MSTFETRFSLQMWNWRWYWTLLTLKPATDIKTWISSSKFYILCSTKCDGVYQVLLECYIDISQNNLLTRKLAYSKEMGVAKMYFQAKVGESLMVFLCGSWCIVCTVVSCFTSISPFLNHILVRNINRISRV